MSEPVRILQVFGCLDRGGAENMIMSVYRNIDRSEMQFDFVVHLDREGDFDSEVKAMGGRIFCAPKYSGLNHFEYKKWWDSFFKNHPEYKILHSHVRSTASIYTKLAKKYGIKTIVHSHNAQSGKGLSAKAKDFLQNNITDYADVCLACSALAGDWLFKGHEYTLMPNTIDVKKFSYNTQKREELRKSLGCENSFLIGHVGRFHAQKNHRFLMDIFSEVLKIKPDAKLLMVGDNIGSSGIPKSELEAYAKEKGIYDSCIFAGNVSNVSDYLSAFDVFVFPSIHEGLPVTLIEAQAACLPCIVSSNVSKECAVTDLVEFESIDKPASVWAQEIIKKDGFRRYDMSRQMYDAGYDVKAGAKMLTDIYSDLLNSR